MTDAVRTPDGCDPVEDAFVRAYLGEALGNAAKALMIAKPHIKPNSAKANAVAFLRRPAVREAIRARMAMDHRAMSLAERIYRLTAIARGEPLMTDEDGKPLDHVPFGEITVRDQMAAMAELGRLVGDSIPASDEGEADVSVRDLVRVVRALSDGDK